MSAQNPKFFYKINKELKKLGIKFRILNTQQRIPYNSNIVLTTLEERNKIVKNNDTQRTIILPYDENKDFNKYIFNFLKTYHCGQKEHSELLFSIDPGKTIGLIVFLEGYFFYSKTFYNEKDLLSNIFKCVENIREESKKQIKLIFKIGRGVFSSTLNLITEIYKHFKQTKKIKIFLINELKSSKVKFHKLFENLSKHEASALILALRKGIMINKENYLSFFELKKSDKKIKQKLEKELNEISFLNQNIDLLKSLIINLLNCKITINKAFDIINQKRVINQYSE